MDDCTSQITYTLSGTFVWYDIIADDGTTKSHILFQVHLFGMISLRMMAQVKSGTFVWYDIIADDGASQITYTLSGTFVWYDIIADDGTSQIRYICLV